MRYEKEIYELEQKLEQLKQAAFKEDEPRYTIHRVPAVSSCFEDMPIVGCSREIKLYDISTLSYTHPQACDTYNGTTIPMRLMTRKEIHLLIACGILTPDDRSFWSSSVRADAHNSAWQFFGFDGSVSSSRRTYIFGVRCVGRP